MSHLKDPIFVVGAPRSGTTLLASMLAAHGSIVSGPETQLLNKVQPTELARCTDDRYWPRRAVATMMDVKLSGERVVDLFDLTEEDLRTYLRDQPHTTASMFSAFFEAAGRLPAGKRWLEKTPNHLIRIDAIMRAFPSARIVRIVRDPRDVAASLSKVPWASRSHIANAWDWRRRHMTSRDQVAAHPDAVLTVRYEDLLTTPEHVLSEICDHVGIEFSASMLSPESAADALTTNVEPWKAKNSSALDPSRAYSWQRERGAVTEAISVLCADAIDEFDYPEPLDARSTVSAYLPGRSTATLVDRFLIRVSQQGTCVVEASPRQRGHVLVPSVVAMLRARLYRPAAKVVRARIIRFLTRRPTSTIRDEGGASSTAGRTGGSASPA